MVDWCTGMINRVAFVLATQPVMGALHGGRHVNGRRVAYGVVQQLQVRMCCGECGCGCGWRVIVCVYPALYINCWDR